MAEKKTKVENPDGAIICPKCSQKKVPMRLVGSGKQRMVFECKCGIFDKTGVKI